MPQTERVSLDDARNLIARALAASGVGADAAAAVAIALVAAEAEGQSGHGFSRLEDYVAQVRTGKVNPDAQVTVHAVSPTGLVVDADHGFAFPALDLAIARGAEAARSQGSATMAIRKSHHCGALSVQVEKLASQGLVGLMVANSPPAIAPWGTGTPIFGTNPIAFAVPRPDGAPLIIDLSLSRVARGKVMHARKSGQKIPRGGALDRPGAPTTDPEAALGGSMVPIGEAKGTALALMVEILASVVTGANSSPDVSSFFKAEGPPPGAGQFLLALKPDDPAAFASRLEPLLDRITALEGARLPGARRTASIARAKAEGLDVPVHYLATARKLAGEAH